MRFLIRIFVILFLFIITITTAFSQNYQASNIMIGIDKLIASDFKLFEGKKVALVANISSRSRDGVATLDAFKNQSACKLTTLLTPEHGYYGSQPAGAKVASTTIEGIKAYSLYGDNRKPTAGMLANCDIVVFDLQDIGVRGYTYISTLYNVMDACAEHGKRLFVLDRPNPLGGNIVDGNTVESGMESFVSIVPVSYIHGMTFGEIARMINAEGWLGSESGKIRQCKLTVVKMLRWQRNMTWEDTGFHWYPTSPHIPTVNAIRGAAVIGPIGELGIVNVGIGTTLPFQYIGINHAHFDNFFSTLKADKFNCINYKYLRYKPFYGKFKNEELEGIILQFTTDSTFEPYSSGIKMLLAIRKAWPNLLDQVGNSQIEMFNKVCGIPKFFEAIRDDQSYETIMLMAQKGKKEFIKNRGEHLIY